MAIILLIIAGSANGGQACCGIATDGIGSVLNERQRIGRLVTGCTAGSSLRRPTRDQALLRPV